MVKKANILSGVFSILYGVALSNLTPTPTLANDLIQPWKDSSKALVLDAYEFNPLDWMKIVADERIAGFIGKASDGLSAKYCPPVKNSICGEKWRRYSVSKELYHTRRQLAKSLGLKWGGYHLGRAGNPIRQAAHFLEFAQPKENEAIVLDIETTDSNKYISFEDAEIFAKYIHDKIGRYPILYTNHTTAQQIAAQKDEYPVLSRMKLWYARYKDDVADVFPLGNWEKPALWQFAFAGNCKTTCPYRVNGTPKDIDVNASMLTVSQIRDAWPFDGLVKKLDIKKDIEKVDPVLVGSISSPAIDEANAVSYAEPILTKSCNRDGYVVGSKGKEIC